MTIRVEEWSQGYSVAALGLDLNSQPGKTRIRRDLRSLLRTPGTLTSYSTPVDLHLYCDLFSEQVAFNAVTDIDWYLRFTRMRGLTPGGVPTGFSPFRISAKDVQPSKSAISTLGEGLAGWLLLQQHYQVIARPIAEWPDLLAAKSDELALVQVKATQEPDVLDPMIETAPEGLQYTRNCSTSKGRQMTCLVIGVIIESASDYRLRVMRLVLR